MKSNAILKFIVVGVIAFILVLVLVPSGKKSGSFADDPSLHLSADEAKALGIEGDTAKDTLATLLGQMKQTRREIQDVKNKNDELLKENDRLRARESDFTGRINKAVSDATANAREEILKAQENANKEFNTKTKGIMDKFNFLQGKIGDLTSNQNAQLPIGGSNLANEDNEPKGIIWVEPDDAIVVDPRNNQKNTGFAFPNAFGSTVSEKNKSFNDSLDQVKKPLELRKVHYSDEDRLKDEKPVYTIAQNSTFVGSTAMTALIGRVPVNGTVSDPYPFKVLVGKDNLAANGFDLPEVHSAVMSGTATGDWTLSCVRGQIDSITFVFEDGTIRTVPEPVKASRSNGNNNTSNTNTSKIRGGLGYISDPVGIPCVSGERKSNAKEYIGTQSLITAAGAGLASVLSKDDKGSNGGYYSSNNSTSSDRNGALNTILSGGVEDVRNWVNKLYGEAFAAIYVPPHAEIAVHIDQEIMIDYEPNGRKVRHNAYTTKNSSLD
ncbi:TIGR03752 family integrating conjugative element protein [Entomomonas sp. E2T0]|uniref:TIGR03752 family integrating conjugative element protein n=1 Tax=Entomomonas sp. E2T0 TaxID=2930213 RepID=UPI00222825BA|nr:TIGR03752 family integrating conjugative element protein [Entomomonas sp. E2T0]UYZ83079.1 TIGR03752 family integrating conjugative element protein [Entomomonas sp. E2T0]